MSAERPKWCQDPACKPVSNTPHSDGPGESGFCVGLLPEPRTFSRHGVEHVNDCHFCFKTPVKGVSMFEINEPDADLLARLMLHLTVAKKPDRDFSWPWYTGRKEDKS